MQPYALALASVLVTIGVGLAIQQVAPTNAIAFLLFVPPILVTALWMDLRASLAATLVGGLAAEYFFRAPYFTLPKGMDEIVPLSLYLVIGAGTSVLGHRLARARLDAQTRALELDTLMRVSPIGIAIANDPECRRISVNPAMAAMLRIRPSDNGSMTAPPDERPLFQVMKDGVPVDASELPLQRAARLGVEVRDVELDVQHPDGTKVSLYEYANPLFDSRGAVRGAIGAFLDISERRRGEEALKRAMAENAELYRQAQEANQLKDEFLATLSHELRTPLNALLGWIQLLRSGQLSEAKRGRALDAIERSAELQARLTADLLDVSAAMTGKLRLNREQVAVAPLIEGVVESLRTTAEEKGLQLHSRVDSVGAMHLDPSRLQQIMANLLSNAIKFTPAGGRVDVTVSEVDERSQHRRRRHGDWHSRRVPAVRVRSIPPGGCRSHARARRTRAGPGDCPSPGGTARRQGRSHQPRAPGRHVHGAVAASRPIPVLSRPSALRVEGQRFFVFLRSGAAGWTARAIMTSVDLTIARASSPRRSFSAATASAVITAVRV